MKNIAAAEEFAKLLEEVGGYIGAWDLVQDELVPLAVRKGMSLISAAKVYADDDADEGTSSYKLFLALVLVPVQPINDLDIHNVW
jgi:hypothetical protein